MRSEQNRGAVLREAASKRILLLDGAMGTAIQDRDLDEAAFRGERFADHPSDLQGNNDLLTLTRPDGPRSHNLPGNSITGPQFSPARR